jgi:hypothetical protein
VGLDASDAEVFKREGGVRPSHAAMVTTNGYTMKPFKYRQKQEKLVPDLLEEAKRSGIIMPLLYLLEPIREAKPLFRQADVDRAVKFWVRRSLFLRVTAGSPLTH